MANLLNMDGRTYNKYETNPGRMKANLTQHLANTFNIPVSELMPENGSTNNVNGVVNAQHYYHVPIDRFIGKYCGTTKSTNAVIGKNSG